MNVAFFIFLRYCLKLFIIITKKSELRTEHSQGHPYKHRSDFYPKYHLQGEIEGKWYALRDYEGFKILKPVELRRSPELVSDLILQLARSGSYKGNELEEILSQRYDIERDFAHNIIWQLYSLGKINADSDWRMITPPQVVSKVSM